MVHLFHLFQFAKSELEQDSANRAKTQVNTEKFCSNFFGTNWNRPRNSWRTSSSPADAFGVRAEDYLSLFLPINERK